MPAFKDLTGQKFGRLLVLEKAGKQGTKITWKCLCECGNEKIIIGNNLTQGKIKSCGCYKKEKQAQWGASTALDLTGQQFGELKVLERAFDIEQQQRSRPLWKCLCSCGNLTYVHTAHLRDNSTRSCRHIFSHGNQKVLNILQNNNIPYIKELTINYQNKIYRYDFAILNSNKIVGLIEYDGEQHFKVTRGWNTPENFEKQQQIDKIKNEYAKINNIPLIRIPYYDYEKLDFNYLKNLLTQNNILY